MSYESPDRSVPKQRTVKVLRIESLNEFSNHEREIVRRIGAQHEGGRLLLLDPLRLLREVSVELTPRAIEETERAHPGFFSSQGHARAYELVAKSIAVRDVHVSVKALFPGAST